MKAPLKVNKQRQHQGKRSATTGAPPVDAPANEHSSRARIFAAERIEAVNGVPSAYVHSLPSDDQNDIINASLPDVEELATSLITGLPSGYTYHCIEHTRQVVENVRNIAEASFLSERDTLLALVAAWLHDVGFQRTYIGHEKESCKVSRSSLSSMLQEKEIRTVESAILATRIPQKPKNIISEVVCDADLLYLGGDQFSLWSGRLREEHLRILQHSYSDLEWIDVNLNFMRGHTFFTEFARKECNDGFQRNFRALERMKLEL